MREKNCGGKSCGGRNFGGKSCVGTNFGSKSYGSKSCGVQSFKCDMIFPVSGVAVSRVFKYFLFCSSFVCVAACFAVSYMREAVSSAVISSVTQMFSSFASSNQQFNANVQQFRKQ